ERAGEVRQRAARHDRDLAGSPPDVLEPDVDGVAVAERAGCGRKLGVTEALRPVRLWRRLDRPDEGPFVTERHLEVRPSRELEHGPRVALHLARVDGGTGDSV